MNVGWHSVWNRPTSLLDSSLCSVFFWGSCSSQIRFWDSSVIAQWFERIDVCATLNEAGGKDCLCNPLETLHRNGLTHRTFSDQLTRQHMILDNAQTLGARLRQQL